MRPDVNSVGRQAGSGTGPGVYLRSDLGGVSPQRLQHTCCHTLSLAQQAEQDVLGADVVVACMHEHMRGWRRNKGEGGGTEKLCLPSQAQQDVLGA